MGIICAKANSVVINCVFWMSIYFSNAFLKNFFEFIYITLFNYKKIYNLFFYYIKDI